MTLIVVGGNPDKINTGLTGGGSNTYVTEIQTIFKSPTGVMVVVDNFFLCQWL